MNLDNVILAGLIDRSPYPIYVIVGDELTVALANAATLTAWGKDSSVIGKAFSQALPELKNQPFESLLRKVMQTGEAYHALNDRAEFIIDGQRQVSYFTFSYEPLFENSGKSIGVVCYATNVTSLVESAQRIVRLNEQALFANEQLALSNTKLEIYNEELATTNEELTESYHLLELSERRFKTLIRQAPFAICVINARDLIVTDINDQCLILLGKKREQMKGFCLWDSLAEVADIYSPIIENVIATGRTYFAKEAKLSLCKSGRVEHLFIDFTYEPVMDSKGLVSAIMIVGIDVSEKVNSRKAIQEVEERIRLAIEAGDIGTYEYRFDTDSFITSNRFNQIVGVKGNLSRKELVSRYHPDDVWLSDLAQTKAKETGKVLYEARIAQEGEQTKWVKFQAKVYYDANGNPERTLGTAVDITQHKILQQQKDDFISIASHELKTPITSLKASLQLLASMKGNLSSAKSTMLIDRAMRSMDKISGLVEDLLNVSKMNQGQIELKKTWFPAAKLLESSCYYIRESTKYTLVLEGDLNSMIFADEHQIEQVVVNFLNNIVKYASETSHIFIKVDNQGEVVKISVKDTGPGIPAEKISRIFERYFRIDTSYNQVSGLGLGLYISAEIIKRHDGHIGVNSKVGAGSTFWFTLPIANTNEVGS